MTLPLDRCIFNATSTGTGSFVVASAVTGYQSPNNANAIDGGIYKYAAQVVDVNNVVTAWEVGIGTYTVGTVTLTRGQILYSSNSNLVVNFASIPQVMVTILKEDFDVLTTQPNEVQTGTAYTVAADDAALVLNPSGAFTLTLPSPATNSGRWLNIKNIASAAIVSASANVKPVDSNTAGSAILPASIGNNALLQSDGTNWVVFAGTQRYGWEVITDFPISGTPTNVDFTGLDALTQYAKFRLDILNVTPTTDNSELFWRVGTGATPTWQTGAVYSSMGLFNSNGTPGDIGDTAAAQMRTGMDIGNQSDECFMGYIEFNLGANATANFNVLAFMVGEVGDSKAGFWGCRHNVAGLITAVRLFWVTGTWQNVGRVILSGQRIS